MTRYLIGCIDPDLLPYEVDEVDIDGQVWRRVQVGDEDCWEVDCENP